MGAIHLLIIEDEFRLASILRDFFLQEHFLVTVCHRGDTGYQEARRTPYDAIICDVMLPVMDGFSVLRKLRAEGVRTPVLFLTARAELQDKLEGFSAGAEDYLTKPFEMQELDARIHVLLRLNPQRSEVAGPEIPVRNGAASLTISDLTLDKNTHVITSSYTGKSTRLSQKEYILLVYFLQNPGQLLSKEQISEQLWEDEGEEPEYNKEEVYISFLRKKMKFIGTKLQILTVRGAGYRLEAGT
ncbi:MAG: response regulator transcription factor [Eubacterium sp.]|nr:response regulator transcription factor [Eubacterium sp.]